MTSLIPNTHLPFQHHTPANLAAPPLQRNTNREFAADAIDLLRMAFCQHFILSHDRSPEHLKKWL
jgi:hypothetical protein